METQGEGSVNYAEAGQIATESHSTCNAEGTFRFPAAYPSAGGSLRGGNGDLHRGNAADRLRLSGFN